MKNLSSFSNIQQVISDYINGRPERKRVFDLKPQNVDHELFLQLAKLHVERYGYLPESWEKYIRNYNRFTNLLIENGHDLEELKGLTLIELRDMCSEHEYIETKTVTSSGGVSTRKTRVPSLKDAA